MVFPERFSNLPEYAFPRLRKLLDVHQAGGDPINMSIGEPRHPFPEFIGRAISEALEGFGRYPPNEGGEDLRAAIVAWIARRYGVHLDADQHILALNGTREGLFNAALALGVEGKAGQKPAVLMPNPFYQVYAVASLAINAEPIYVPATAETGDLPDYAALPAALLDRVTIAYLCSPANPQGAVATEAYWRDLIALAEKHDFRIFADECYSEIYRNTPPVGALQVAHDMGADPDRVVAFHSLSKRSNLPGLRSGFAASGSGNIAAMKQLKNYTGAPLPLPLQAAAALAWRDEAHVEENRAIYRRKYQMADEIFGNVAGYQPLEAGFFLWLPVENDEAAALKLWREAGVRCLPGSYLSRAVAGQAIGQDRLRVALVAEEQELQRGLLRLHGCLYQ